MRVARRIRALEREVGREADVTWQEAYAAYDRLQERLYAKVTALAGRGDPPVDDHAAGEADEEVLRRWRRQRGIQEPDADEVRAQLREKLERMERSMTWERT